MLIVRVLSILLNAFFNPLVSFVKRGVAIRYHPLTESFFYHFGKFSHRLHMRIQQMASSSSLASGSPKIKEMERWKTFEYGTEVFFEYFFPSAFAIGIALNQLRKNKAAARAAKKRTKDTKKQVDDLYNELLEFRKRIEASKIAFRQQAEKKGE